MSDEPKPDALSDLAELADRVRRGDAAAFERLFRICHGALCEVVDSYVRSQDVAEEIVQDLFFLLWTKRDELPEPRSFRAYLFTAARNRALHHLRHRATVRHWSARVDTHPGVAGTAAGAPDTADSLIARDRASALRLAIDGLPPRTRLALLLQLEYGMRQADIAVAMGISVKAVEKLTAVAKAKLRISLESHGPDAISVR